MRQSFMVGSLPALCTCLVFISLDSFGQSGGIKEKPRWSQPRTQWGDPDLQGIWNNDTITPFERDPRFGNRRELTEKEIAEQTTLAAAIARGDKTGPTRPGDTGAGPEHWYERGKPTKATSLVVDPPDGRLPPLTSEGTKRREDLARHRREHPADTYTDLDVWTRCITRGLPNAMIPTYYNNNYQILQLPGYVIIHYELIHDVRVIPLDGRPHVPPNIRQWMGDSRGHWEGNTLVVDVTNFSDLTQDQLWPGGSYRGSGADLHLTERFTRPDADTIDYEFTIDAPNQYTKPWTAVIPMRKEESQDELLEYGCHEGNYAIVDILSGARKQQPASPAK